MNLVLRRLIALVPTWIGITITVFLLAQLIPGDPVTVMLSRQGQSTPELVAELRARFGMDQPVYVQYLRWLWRVLHLDLGRSFVEGQKVSDILASKFKASLILAMAGFVLAVGGGIVVGTGAAVAVANGRHILVEKTLTLTPLLLLSTPSFVTGLFLIVIFTVKLRLLPATGMYSVIGGGGAFDRLGHLILPAFALGAPSLASTARLSCTSLLEILGADYIRTARGKGLHERVILYRHALRNALMPVVTNSGILLGNLLAGSVIVETVFSWPGIGFMMMEAIGHRDYPVIQGATLVISTLYVLLNLLVDCLYAYIDPRIRHG